MRESYNGEKNKNMSDIFFDGATETREDLPRFREMVMERYRENGVDEKLIEQFNIHNRQVENFVAELSAEEGFTEKQQEIAILAAIFHDVTKGYGDFLKHGEEGGQIAYDILIEAGKSPELAWSVKLAIERHMGPNGYPARKAKEAYGNDFEYPKYSSEVGQLVYECDILTQLTEDGFNKILLLREKENFTEDKKRAEEKGISVEKARLLSVLNSAQESYRQIRLKKVKKKADDFWQIIQEKYKDYFKENSANELMAPDWVEKLNSSPIVLEEEKPDFSLEELKNKYSNEIVLVDSYIRGIEEKGVLDNGVFRADRIINIDHHAPCDEFARNISSTNLAIDWVKKNGIISKDAQVIINHTDCDSILASLILRGILPPDERFARAAIAGDHTGEENDIADLLQSMEDKRDLEFSARNLKLLLEGKSIEPEAERLLEKTRADRKRAKEAIEKDAVSTIGKVTCLTLEKKVESSYFPALLPESKVILVFSPLEKDPSRWEVKIRLGMAAPQGLTLDKLGIKDIDPNFGGRWNAGSNRRGGGTVLNIEEYAKKLNEKIEAFLRKED